MPCPTRSLQTPPAQILVALCLPPALWVQPPGWCLPPPDGNAPPSQWWTASPELPSPETGHLLVKQVFRLQGFPRDIVSDPGP